MTEALDSVAQQVGSPADLLAAHGVDFTVHTHEQIRTADDIRERTDLDIEHSVKTMAFSIAPDRLVLAGIPGPARIKYGRLAAALGVPRKQLRPAGQEALTALGMAPGGVSPVCRAETVTVVLDSAVPDMGLVYCGSGRPDQSLRLEAADLVRIAGNVVVADVAEPAG